MAASFLSPGIGLQKKPRFRGVVGRLLVWRSFFSLLLSGALSVRRIILGPDLSSSSVSLACLLPNRAAVPLMDGYEQHACQRTHPAGRGGLSGLARRVTVTLRTVRDPFLGFNPTRALSAPRRLADADPVGSSESVKILDAFGTMCSSQGGRVNDKALNLIENRCPAGM
jgi:hypothetical protein